MSQSFTADQVVENRFRLKKDVTVFYGYPGSEQSELWSSGMITPPVTSWIEEDGQIYWTFREIGTRQLIKHDPDSLKVIEESGGADFIDTRAADPDKATNVIFSGIGSTLDFLNLQNLGRAGKAIAAIGAVYVSFKIYQISK